MKRFTALAAAILLLFLCACTKQTKTDIYGFADRLNSSLSEALIDPSAYYCFENEYYYFPSQGFMLTLSTDEARTVNRCEITLTPTEQAPDAENTLEAFKAMCCVLCNGTPENVSDIFSKNSLDESKISFSDSALAFSDGNYEYFIYSSSEIISLMCEAVS